MQQRLPTKLDKEPLIDAIFEMRLVSTAPLSSILPGILFSQLGNVTGIERLPAADLPKPVRDLDQNLRFAPTVRVVWQKFWVLLSDQSISLACTLPYPGWAEFRAAILQVLNIVEKTKFIERVERYSLKYVDLIESSDLGEQAAFVNLTLKLGAHLLEKENFQVRLEIPEQSFINAVQLVSAATATLADQTQKQGLIIDIDTIQNVDGIGLAKLIENFPDRLTEIHKTNKSTFFSCLTDKALQSLGPKYE